MTFDAFYRFLSAWRILSAIAIVTIMGGCSAPSPEKPDKSGVVGGRVAVWCSEPRYQAEFEPRMTAWAKRNGVELTTADEATADVLLIPAGEIGRRVVAGELAAVPESVIGEASGFQWNGLLRAYQGGVVLWGATEYAIPVVGEGAVLIYRRDQLNDPRFVQAFKTRHRSDPLPVRTWEDLAEIAAIMTEQTGRPSLPPLPSDDTAALTEFCRIAACYDRAPLSARSADDFRRGRSFLTNAETGAPRVGAQAFVQAFKWFSATSRYRSPENDPLDAVVRGDAVAAVLPLSDVAKLPRDPITGAVDARFGVSGIPGTRSYFNADDVRKDVATPNFVPYHAGGLVGVVRKTSGSPDACWSLLGDMGGPEGSTLTIGSVAVGSGPTRSIHVSDGNRLWGQYRFDEESTAALGQALTAYAAKGVVNPAIGLRTPDLNAVTTLLVRQIRRAAGGEATADEAVKQSLADWNELDTKTPEDQRKMWRKKTAGME